MEAEGVPAEDGTPRALTHEEVERYRLTAKVAATWASVARVSRNARKGAFRGSSKRGYEPVGRGGA